MSGTLFNVRLDPDRRRKVRALRARGIALSDVVRAAIDERFATLDPSATRRDVRAWRGSLRDIPIPRTFPPAATTSMTRRQPDERSGASSRSAGVLEGRVSVAFDRVLQTAFKDFCPARGRAKPILPLARRSHAARVHEV